MYNCDIYDFPSCLNSHRSTRSDLELAHGHLRNEFDFWNIHGIMNTLGEGAQWLRCRVLDSRPKGRGFEPQRRHCVAVLEQDTFILTKHWFNPGRPFPV